MGAKGRRIVKRINAGLAGVREDVNSLVEHIAESIEWEEEPEQTPKQRRSKRNEPLDATLASV